MSDRTFIAERNESKSRENSLTDTSVGAEVDKIVIRSVLAFAGVVGLWVTACIASAMYHAGGPIQLVRSWFGAVTGM